MRIVALLTLVFALPALASDGAAIYKAKCALCHGADGSGNTPPGKSLKVRDLRSAEVQQQTDGELANIINAGKGNMPAYGKQLSEADVDALIGFIRTLKK